MLMNRSNTNYDVFVIEFAIYSFVTVYNPNLLNIREAIRG